MNTLKTHVSKPAAVGKAKAVAEAWAAGCGDGAGR